MLINSRLQEIDTTAIPTIARDLYVTHVRTARRARDDNPSVRNRHPSARQERELGDRLSDRGRRREAVGIEQDVPRVRCIHDADVWRERDSAATERTLDQEID